LLLRPPERRDAPDIALYAADYDVSKNLANMPHPYGEADAHAYIARQPEARAMGTNFGFAVTRKSDGAFLGCCGLHLEGGKFEMGYWIGKPFWGQGYATEAARRVIGFAFHDLKAEAVWAGWYHDNPASGRVLEKLGCRPDGADKRDCLARGHAVYCNLVTLSREDFGRKRVAA
jgi:RimJ/RimL family protein N-acetyltransferase